MERERDTFSGSPVHIYDFHIFFSYIHNFSIILPRVYNEPIQRPAPSWFVDLIRWLIINKP